MKNVNCQKVSNGYLLILSEQTPRGEEITNLVYSLDDQAEMLKRIIVHFTDLSLPKPTSLVAVNSNPPNGKT